MKSEEKGCRELKAVPARGVREDWVELKAVPDQGVREDWDKWKGLSLEALSLRCQSLRGHQLLS